MSRKKGNALAVLVLAAAATFCSPAGATTLLRAGLEQLVTENETIVMGEVLEVVSYWNADSTFILTDVMVEPIQTLKGREAPTLTITLMGGTVGDTTTLIVGNPELVPGRSYVLFLNEEALPGSEKTLTIRDLCQGAYDIQTTKRGALRAVSQANSHPLIPDEQGYFDAPGGIEGFPLEAMLQSVRETVARGGEVNR